MRNRTRTLLLSLLVMLSGMWSSCDEQPEMFPALLSDFVNLRTDAQGVLSTLTTDDGKTYPILDGEGGLAPLATYRVKADYVIDGSYVQLWNAQKVELLYDSTSVVKHDPLEVQSAWRSGDFVNLWLQPKTQGGVHDYGFALDSVSPRHHYISLHHRQGTDPTSFSRDVYASLWFGFFPTVQTGDTLTLNIHTFQGLSSWTFIK